MARSPAAVVCLGRLPAQAQLAVSVNMADNWSTQGRSDGIRRNRQLSHHRHARQPAPKFWLDRLARPLWLAPSERGGVAQEISPSLPRPAHHPAAPTRRSPTPVSVIDLTPLKPALPQRLGSVVGVGPRVRPVPKVIGHRAGARGRSGVSINMVGHSCLGGNPRRGDLSVSSLNGSTVNPAVKWRWAVKRSAPSHVVFSLERRHAFVTRECDNRIAFLSVDGSKWK